MCSFHHGCRFLVVCSGENIADGGRCCCCSSCCGGATAAVNAIAFGVGDAAFVVSSAAAVDVRVAQC